MQINGHTLDELEKMEQAREAKMNAIFTIDKADGVLIINVDYPYCIELSRLKSKNDVLAWVLHLCEKVWIDTDILREFIERVFELRGWRYDNP